MWFLHSGSWSRVPYTAAPMASWTTPHCGDHRAGFCPESLLWQVTGQTMPAEGWVSSTKAMKTHTPSTLPLAFSFLYLHFSLCGPSRPIQSSRHAVPSAWKDLPPIANVGSHPFFSNCVHLLLCPQCSGQGLTGIRGPVLHAFLWEEYTNEHLNEWRKEKAILCHHWRFIHHVLLTHQAVKTLVDVERRSDTIKNVKQMLITVDHVMLMKIHHFEL